MRKGGAIAVSGRSPEDFKSYMDVETASGPTGDRREWRARRLKPRRATDGPAQAAAAQPPVDVARAGMVLLRGTKWAPRRLRRQSTGGNRRHGRATGRSRGDRNWRCVGHFGYGNAVHAPRSWTSSTSVDQARSPGRGTKLTNAATATLDYHDILEDDRIKVVYISTTPESTIIRSHAIA